VIAICAGRRPAEDDAVHGDRSSAIGSYTEDRDFPDERAVDSAEARLKLYSTVSAALALAPALASA
jgi:hypothetical protein